MLACLLSLSRSPSFTVFPSLFPPPLSSQSLFCLSVSSSLSIIFSFHDCFSPFLFVSVVLSLYLSGCLSPTVDGGGNKRKAGCQGSPSLPRIHGAVPLPLGLRVRAGCCPRRGPSSSRAGLIKLIERGDICGGKRLAWLSAGGVCMCMCVCACVCGGFQWQTGMGGWGGALHQAPSGPCRAGDGRRARSALPPRQLAHALEGS